MLIRHRALTTLIILTALISGCTSHLPVPGMPEATRTDISNSEWVKENLYAQYNEWRAVRYQGGGLSKRGIDCSGLVYLTFNSRFAIKLPRSTDEQIHVGPEIPQKNLAPGDLVFFQTGKTTHHVGIYIEDRKFLHTSTEKGVMISSLDDSYWSRAYWKSVRVRPRNDQIKLSLQQIQR